MKKSFRTCGISVDVNDHEIHCLKDGGIAVDARSAISEATSRLMDDNNNEEDPFAALEEDETELYENGIVVEDDS